MFKMLKRLNWRELLTILVCAVLIFGQVWLNLKMPDYLQELMTLVMTSGSKMADVWSNGGMMMLCALGSLASMIIVSFFVARMFAGFAKRIRSMLFNKVESFSMEEMNKFSTASLITRSTNDITQVQMFLVMGMQISINAPITAVWAVIKIANKDRFEWSLAMGLTIAVLLIFFIVVIKLAMPKFRMMQRLTDNMNRVTRENLTGLRVVRAYNAENYQENKFETANAELTGTMLFTSRTMSSLMPVMMLAQMGLSLSIYIIGAVLVNNSQVLTDRVALFANMMVFMNYAMMVIMSIMMLVMIIVMFPRASVAAKRINEVINTEPKINDGKIGVNNAPKETGEIEFKNVSFKYPDAADNILQNISFKAKRGETVAFIGATGSGKTTLINLISRFYDVSVGEVLVDGVNVKDYTLEELNNKIGYVPQKAVLFMGTVRSNVAYGDNGKGEPGDEDVKRAVRIAQSTDFVEQMDGAYDASISQSGANVSGGQKQRISIARAVCRQPEIYIFDDSFSALDYKTDRALRTALKNETAGVTSVIVAQRVGTIMDADRIVVMDEGKVAGIGTHKELLRDCAVYQEIAKSQLSEEELVS